MSSLLLRAQEVTLNVSKIVLDMPLVDFYVANVIDARGVDMGIGTVYTGPFNRKKVARLKGGVHSNISKFLAFNVSKVEDRQVPIYLRLDQLLIREGIVSYGEYGVCELQVSIFDNKAYAGKPVYVAKTRVSDTLQDVFPSHEKRIARAFKTVLLDYWLNHDQKIVDTATDTSKGETEEYVPTEVIEDDVFRQQEQRSTRVLDSVAAYEENQPGGKSVVALGYQIGGWTVLGVEFETRISQRFGIAFGGGFIGGNAGIKYHFNPSKNSTFIYANFKDGGFGQLGSLCLELGSRVPITKNKNGLALHGQIGIQNILYVSDAFNDEIVKRGGSPFDVGDFAFSMGIGISF